MSTKECKYCLKIKDEEKDFYQFKGSIRSKCKSCHIKYVTAYQKKNESWKNRIVDGIEIKSYMQSYYAKNKEKFVKAQKKFIKKNPNYHRDYYRNRKFAEKVTAED